MPYSSPATDAPVRSCLSKLLPSNIRKALDVGVGAGKYGTILRGAFPGVQVHGIEGCQKYLTEFQKQHQENYTSVVHADVREWLKTHHDWSTDIVVFGDVLEHLGYSEALDAVHRASYHCRFMLLVWPERRPQGVYQGNELEVHSCVLLPTDFTRFGMVDYTTVRADTFAKHVLLLKGIL